MMALLCPCVPLAQVASRFSGRTAYVVVLCLGMLLHMSFVVLVYIAWCHNPSHWPSFVEQLTSLFMMQLNDLPIYCWGVWAVLVAYLRSYGRAKMQLAGNFGSDLVVACCCTSCAIAQLATQVDVYAANVRRDDCRQYYFGPRDVLPPYLALEPRKPLKYSSARTVVV
ncbi:hypothetical protein H257_02303 [Aphanomyces astaci]|uniref:Uncharacterized protein n=1 Tax=Aphanomyces astaci TaxID=112090 RepID=W4H3H1_APHAT|nr:hypothetical protein H257_02303 [Aphanomyces astaci]ETV85698.1 hypothetical protein H257_02303 [Aphanomyces astaci]RHY10711.1 hypothetical protein DYB25_007580 [Aphanomyces astaci]RHY13962.1 hypothetical protein DYB36_010682 [Aphanomyces astaci]RHY49260.1 hypothetical protein DYB34_010854 [Aphanomyces astaci]RHY67151.1 hypothetical protein DYB30_008313 [Aphanomyces astaci]|eukprot:XP_009824170.1 hypothetical protein H257_02303 [Aphanomyces astaci]